MAEVDAPVESPVSEPLSPDAELTTPGPDPVEPSAKATEPDQEPTHALEPNGDRFKQVWARAKTAEAELSELKTALQREREERIRYEERAKVQQEQKAQNEPEYTWTQLQGMIDEGKVTLAQALEYREAKVREKAKREATQELEQRLAQTSKRSTVEQDLAKYRELAPEAVQPGSETRQKLEQEFRYLTEVLGYQPTQETELVAARAVLGPVEALARARQAQTKTQAHRETYMETQTAGRPKETSKDPLKALTPEQKEWYAGRIKAGMYSGWDEVKSELTWERGKK
jgi:hypothetical protein